MDMDLHEAWKKLTEKEANVSSLSKEEIIQAIYQESKSPMEQLRKRMFMKMMWIIFFIVLFIALMVANRDSAYRLWLIGIFTGYYIFALVVMGIKYQKIRQVPGLSQNMKSTMEYYYKRVKGMLSFEEWWGAVFYPVAVTLGFLLGGSFGKLDTYEKAFSKPTAVIVLLVTIFMVSPLAILLTRWLNKKAFGEYLTKLKANIQALKE